MLKSKNLLGEEKMWQAGNGGYQPTTGSDGGSSGNVWDGKLVERSADGQVPLHRERHDRQHTRVRGSAIGQDGNKIYSNY